MKHNVSDKFRTKEEKIDLEILYLAPTLDLENEQIYFCKLIFNDDSIMYDAYCQGILDGMQKLSN